MDFVRLQSLTSALRNGDWHAIERSLPHLRSPHSFSHAANMSRPQAMKSLTLQAALSAPVEEAGKVGIVQEILEMGADPNIEWTDCSGKHTPLSKSLTFRHWSIAQLLINHGADPTTALTRTDLLECCHFSPAIVRWLVDHGAVIGTSDSVPVMTLLKCSKEVKIRRQIQSIHASLNIEKERPTGVHMLLESVAQTCMVLLASGARPLVSCKGLGFTPEDWGILEPSVCQVPSWDRHIHRLFPMKFHRAAKTLLLIEGVKGFGETSKERYVLGPLAMELVFKHLASQIVHA